MINRIFESEPQTPAQAQEGQSAELSQQPAAAIQAVERWIGEHPVVCFGLAAVTGVVIGCLLKRR